MTMRFKNLSACLTITIFILVSSCSKTTPSPSTCAVPSSLSATNVAATTATVNWPSVTGATYVVQYRVLGTTVWSNINSTTDSAKITGLTASTNYEFQVQSVCGSSISAYSQSGTFSTHASNSNCPNGYYGVNCDTMVNAKFAGIYNVSDTAMISGQQHLFNYIMTIEPSTTNPFAVTITYFGGFSPSSTTNGTVSGSKLIIPNSTIGMDYITNVTDTLIGNTFSFFYTATDSTGVSIDHAIATKQ